MTLPKFEVPKGPDASADTYDPNSDKPGKQAIDWVYSNYQRVKQQRGPEERKWSTHLTMTSGNQYLRQTGFGDHLRLVTPALQRGRVRSTTNLIRRLVRTEQNFYTSQKPSASVIPSSGEQEDMYAALGGEQVWESYYSRKRLKQMWVRNSFWLVVTGNSFTKVTWDQDNVPKDQNALYDLGGQTVSLPPQGDIDIRLITPFHIFVPDLLEPEIEDQEFVMQAYTKPMAWAEKLGIAAKADCVATNEILNSVYFNESANQNAKPDSILVIEAWIKPGSVRELPDGGFITVAGQQVIAHSPWDDMYSHGEFPYSHAKNIETGKFYGASILEDAIPLQREYNATRNQIIESKQRMARPQWWVAEGSVDIPKMNSVPGVVNEYKQGYPAPTPMGGVEIPSFVINEQDRIKADLEDITGQHAVTQGSAPGSGVTAATAIGFLQERDDALRGTGYASVETMWEKTARQTLCLFADYVDIPRAIQVVGQNHALNVVQLKGADIRNGLDIRIEAGSMLPTSKAAKQEFLMNLVTAGIISPEDFLSLLDFGGVDRLYERIRIDEDEAQRENIRFKNLNDQQIQQYMMEMQQKQLDGTAWDSDPTSGMPLNPATIIPVQDWQNHQVHIKVHNDYRKTTEFELFPDMIKEFMAQHVQLHQLALDGQMSGAMMSGGAPEGMSGAPEDGSAGAVGLSGSSQQPAPDQNAEMG